MFYGRRKWLFLSINDLVQDEWVCKKKNTRNANQNCVQDVPGSNKIKDQIDILLLERKGLNLL